MTEQERRSIDTEAQLDAEIGALFAVDPSPHFESRVRARVAEAGRRPSPAWQRWLVPASAIVATAVTVALWPERRVDIGAAPLAARAIDVPFTTAVVAEPIAFLARTISAPVSAAPVERTTPRFEVIVDPAESAALQRLMARGVTPAVQTRVAAAAPAGELPLSIDAIEIRAMADIQPISIETLAVVEGVAQ